MNIKTKLANWLIKLAFKLNKFHLDKCTMTLESPKVTIKSFVPQDGLWHNINMNLNYWVFVGDEIQHKEEKEELYIDGIKVNFDPIGDPNIQTKIENYEPLDNPGMEPWTNENPLKEQDDK